MGIFFNRQYARSVRTCQVNTTEPVFNLSVARIEAVGWANGPAWPCHKVAKHPESSLSGLIH